jgi:hypothetical protein
VTASGAWVVAVDGIGPTAPSVTAVAAYEVGLDGGWSPRVALPQVANAPATAFYRAGRRGFVVNGVPHAHLPGGIVYRTAPGSAGIYVGNGETSVASDGTRFAAGSEQYGPQWLTYSGPLASPVVEQVENSISSSPPWGANNFGATGRGAYTIALSGQHRFVAYPVTYTPSPTRQVRAWRQVPGGPWQVLPPLPADPRELRSVYLGTTPLLCGVYLSPTGRQLNCHAWNGTAWSALLDLAPGSVDHLDLFASGPVAWLSYAVGGRVYVRALQVGPTGLTQRVLTGPGGTPAWSLNPGCDSTNPEAFATSSALWLTWEDATCTSNNNQLVNVLKVE